jgi:hypothetical protein
MFPMKADLQCFVAPPPAAGAFLLLIQVPSRIDQGCERRGDPQTVGARKRVGGNPYWTAGGADRAVDEQPQPQ